MSMKKPAPKAPAPKAPAPAPKKPAAPAPKKAEAPGKKPELEKFLDEVKKRAYEIYQERAKAKTPGDQLSDWLKAEKEIKAKYKM
jgi:hypothetical protein